MYFGPSTCHESQIVGVRHAVGLHDPRGRVHGDLLRIACGNEFGELVPHRRVFAGVGDVAVAGPLTVLLWHPKALALRTHRSSEIDGAAHIDVLHRARFTEDGALDAISQIGEHQIPVGRSEVLLHQIGRTLPIHVDPHVDTVVSHRHQAR